MCVYVNEMNRAALGHSEVGNFGTLDNGNPCLPQSAVAVLCTFPCHEEEFETLPRTKVIPTRCDYFPLSEVSGKNRFGWPPDKEGNWANSAPL